MSDYQSFTVGEPFPLPIVHQADGGMFQVDGSGAMFILQLSRADVIAAEAFRTGAMEFALTEEDGILFLLYRIDGIFKDGWGDCPLALHLVRPEHRPTAASLRDTTLHLYLVDTRLQLLLALRDVPMTPDFHGVLTRYAEAHANETVDATAFAKRLRAVWAAHTSADLRARAAAVLSVPLALVPQTP